MSIQLIQKYYAEIDRIIRYGGSRNESSLRKPFQDLLEGYARAKGLVVVAEVELESKKGTRIRPDGVLKDALGLERNVSRFIVTFPDLTGLHRRLSRASPLRGMRRRSGVVSRETCQVLNGSRTSPIGRWDNSKESMKSE